MSIGNYSSHSLWRMVDRVVDTSRKRMNKKQRKKAFLKMPQKIAEDTKKRFAYFDENGYEYYYVNLEPSNMCLKYIRYNSKVITVVKVNFYNELKKHPIKFVQKKIENYYAISQNNTHVFLYDEPKNDMCLKYIISKETKKIEKYYYVNFVWERFHRNGIIIPESFQDKDELKNRYLNGE